MQIGVLQSLGLKSATMIWSYKLVEREPVLIEKYFLIKVTCYKENWFIYKLEFFNIYY